MARNQVSTSVRSSSEVNKKVSFELRCPFCSCKDVVKNGFRNTETKKKQRHRCKRCNPSSLLMMASGR